MNANQLRVLTAIRQWWLDNAYSPSITDLEKKLGLTRKTIHYWITRLKKAGAIRTEGGVARSIRLVGMEVVLPPLEKLVALVEEKGPESEQEQQV